MVLPKRRGLYERNRIIYVPIDELSISSAQPRKVFEPDGLKELAVSISRYGVLQPLTVRRSNSGYELVSGDRRLRASALAGLTEVPCVVLDVDNSDSAIVSLIENLQRRDLDFIEEAQGLSELIRLYGMSQEDVARRIGISQSAVANKLRILKLPRDMLYTIREAGLSQRHARALLKLDGNDLRSKALETILREHMTVALAEEYIDSLAEGSSSPRRPVFMLKDVRLFLNTLSRAIEVMNSAGINAKIGTSETDTDMLITIQIPKDI